MDAELSSVSHARKFTIAAAEQPAATASISRAKELHEQGRLDDAVPQYQAVLAERPDDAEALHLYGVLQFQRGYVAEAETLIRRAISISPQPLWLANLGSILAHQGHRADALEQFEAALRIDSKHVQTLVRLGNTLIELRRYESALSAYGRALKVAPMLLDALCNQGAALRALGRYQEALETYERALTVDPRSFESLYNLGNVLRDLQRYPQALGNYERALAVMPGSPEVLSARGRTLIDLGRPKEALASFNEAIAAKPDFVEALYNSAVALERLGRAEEAIQRCNRVLALENRHAKAFASRGNALLHLKQYEEALSDYDLALEIEPHAASVLCNRGTVLRQMKHHEAALRSYAAALTVDADFPEAWCNRGGVLQSMHRYEDALSAFDHALALNPKYASAWFNRGNTLFEMFRIDDALRAYNQAIEIDPDYADAHYAQALVYLLQGDFARGWEQYEWRFRDPKNERNERFFSQPRWTGDESLDGRTILIYAEQGLGDSLQFCRYIELVRARGASIVLEVPATLKSLMATLRTPVQLVSTGEPLPSFDFHCPLLSLPLVFRTDFHSIPNQTPYLYPDARQKEKWETLLGAKRRLRIGVAWSGNPEHRNDHNRSLELAMLMPLFELDVEWISLQKVVREHDMAILENTPMLRFDDELADFSDTAALIQSLDLVIAVDTAVAHLTGALNRSLWVLLPHLSEWRWLMDRDDSPWYPGARLFRQSAAGRWTDVVDAVGRAIGELLQVTWKSGEARDGGGCWK